VSGVWKKSSSRREEEQRYLASRHEGPAAPLIEQTALSLFRVFAKVVFACERVSSPPPSRLRRSLESGTARCARSVPTKHHTLALSRRS